MAEATAQKPENAPPETAPPPKEEGSGAPAAGSGSVLLSNRFQILYNQPLPDLDSPSAKAYRVIDQRDTEWKLFGLVSNPGIPPRLSGMTSLKGDGIIGMMPLVTSGVIDFPPLGEKIAITVFGEPLGGRLTLSNDTIDFKISEYDLNKNMIVPLSSGLQELASANLRHRAIRPNNLFFLDEDKTKIVFGECVTTPPGFDQPILFEPIEYAMCDPAGRGQGETTDDLYALGVTLVCIILGKNPLAGLDEKEILNRKVEQGTYNALCGEERIPLAFVEPLRGMLIDELADRWGLGELDLWLNGQKRSPIQRKQSLLAKESFLFMEESYRSPRMLAYAFSKNIPEAAAALMSGKLELWLRSISGLGSTAANISDLALQAIPTEKSPPPNKDILVASACILMDPIAPIRFKGFSARPGGFGSAMALELLHKGNMQVSSEILTSDLISYWFQNQMDYDPDTSTLQKSFEQLKSLLKIADPGYGPERCLYELNPNLPCQSPILAKDYVINIADLLPTLDSIANRSDPKTKPMDRHIAAFIAVRFRQDMTPHLKAMASPDVETALIGMLSLLALLQWKLKPEPLYGLSSWVGGLLGPAINTYQNRTTRRRIELEIPKLVRKGSLPELFDLVDNAEKRKLDASGFAETQVRFAAIDANIEKLEGKSKSGKDSMKNTGQKIAATVSIVTAMIMGTVMFLMEIW